MPDYLSEAQSIAPELIALRRAFHMDPELGNHEFHTAARIEETLNGWGIPTRRLLDTAVVGRLDGALPGRRSHCGRTWTRCRWRRPPARTLLPGMKV